MMSAMAMRAMMTMLVMTAAARTFAVVRAAVQPENCLRVMTNITKAKNWMRDSCVMSPTIEKMVYAFAV